MKIKYNLEYQYLDYYNEVQGILMKKKKLLKGDQVEVVSYTRLGHLFIKVMVFFFLLFLLFSIFTISNSVKTVIDFLFCLSIGLVVAYYLAFYLNYWEDVKRCHRGELQFSKSGLLDVTDDGVKMGLPWHLIEFVVLSGKVICFLTKTPTVYFVNANKREEVLEAIKKYQSELKVVDTVRKGSPIAKTPVVEEEEEIEVLEDIPKEQEDDEVEKAIEALENE